MTFTPTSIEGLRLIDMDRHVDERGWFARTWCGDELLDHGISPALSQCSSSFNAKRGTLRGMHYQNAPFEEAKIVRCTRGAIMDVALDLRIGSPTYRKWLSFELSADNGRALFIPKGCAHGFQTLCDDTEVLYMIDVSYVPGVGTGVRWNDPAFGIQWPLADEAILSERDATYPDFMA
jgi:dTDP-4-dehydrorhamnose 3,5-epimerase